MRPSSPRDVLPNRIVGSPGTLVVMSIMVVSLFTSACVGTALTEQSDPSLRTRPNEGVWRRWPRPEPARWSRTDARSRP